MSRACHYSSLVREGYRESNGSAGARNIAAMVTTKGVKLVIAGEQQS